MVKRNVSAWLKTIKSVTSDDIAKIKSHRGFTAHKTGTNVYSRYVDANSVVDYGQYIYFNGAATPGDVCAGFTSGYEVGKKDIVSQDDEGQCPSTYAPYFRLTYNVA